MLLLIPGPVTTRPEVRAALAQDIAPWDNDFRAVYASIRERVLKIAHGNPAEHTALPLPGCGHFITEAAIRTFVPAGAKILIPDTGRYAASMTRLASDAGRVPVAMPMDADRPADPAAIAAALDADPGIGHVGVVYSETGSGVIHDVPAIGRAVRAVGRRMIVDAVSAFGALPLDISAHPEIDAAVFSSNKCIEALTVIAFAVARIDRLLECANNAGSWCFDLSDLHNHHSVQSGPGRARFTPPVQILAAFAVALDYFEAEGGQPARLARYMQNSRVFYDGMIDLGLSPWLPRDVQGPVIVNMHAPADPAWNLQAFVDALKKRGVLISNFFNTPTPTFRVGCIGAVSPGDMAYAVAAMAGSFNELGIKQRKVA